MFPLIEFKLIILNNLNLNFLHQKIKILTNKMILCLKCKEYLKQQKYLIKFTIQRNCVVAQLQCKKTIVVSKEEIEMSRSLNMNIYNLQLLNYKINNKKNLYKLQRKLLQTKFQSQIIRILNERIKKIKQIFKYQYNNQKLILKMKIQRIYGTFELRSAQFKKLNNKKINPIQLESIQMIKYHNQRLNNKISNQEDRKMKNIRLQKIIRSQLNLQFLVLKKLKLILLEYKFHINNRKLKSQIRY
ncbi:unnamed protein product [Paramecium sonneborni]|uniref:Uncharacterized protein n=1 Tax=Paramecium sonneborni TaxID=65129 RepID=A0A8S1NV38_9CILI|nr:unnamed protein product [Paramecium sonneborni]